MHDIVRSDHRKDSLQANQPILLCMVAVVGIKTHLVVNSNVADKGIFLHGQSIVQVYHKTFDLRPHGCGPLIFLIFLVCSNEILLFLPQVIR